MKFKQLSQGFIFAGSLIFLPQALYANYTGERYGLTALTQSASNISSCTPGINAITRQIETSSTDIQGALPFTRTYQSALQLDFQPSYRSADAKNIDRATASTYLENRGLFGLGWSHNYDFRLITIGAIAYTLDMPSGGLPMLFAKQNDGSIKMSNSSLTPITTDTEYKITDVDNTTVRVNINGTEITFKSLIGHRGLIQEFQATQVKYPGGKVIMMTYDPIRKSNQTLGYRVTGVADNLGNKLKISRMNMNGSDTSTLGSTLQGAIEHVETMILPKN